MEGSPMGHHHGIVLCWTSLGQEADPGILNPGRGPRKINTMKAHQKGPPIGLQKTLTFSQKRRLVLIQKPGAQKKGGFLFVSCSDGLIISVGQHLSSIKNTIRRSLGNRWMMSLSTPLELHGGEPALTPGTRHPL